MTDATTPSTPADPTAPASTSSTDPATPSTDPSTAPAHAATEPDPAPAPAPVPAGPAMGSLVSYTARDYFGYQRTSFGIVTSFDESGQFIYVSTIADPLAVLVSSLNG